MQDNKGTNNEILNNVYDEVNNAIRVTGSGGGGVQDAENGVHLDGDTVKLGGVLTEGTTIDGDSHNLSFNNLTSYNIFTDYLFVGTSQGAELEIDGETISWLSQAAQFIMNTNVARFDDNRAVGFQTGIEYNADYSADFTDRSLVDKEYVDTVNVWYVDYGVIKPKDATVHNLELNVDGNHYTQVKLVNTDDSGNGSGAIIELKGSGADYSNNMYIGKYGASFWIPELTDNGAVMTDKSLVVGTVDNTRRIDFIIGDSYTNINIISHMTNEGLHYNADYSANYTNRTLVDKGYVDTVNVWTSDDSTSVITKSGLNEGGGAPGVYSLSAGWGNEVNGDGSAAFGGVQDSHGSVQNNNEVNGKSSLSIGYANHTDGSNSLTIGNNNFNNGSNSLIIGYNNVSNNLNNFVGGRNALATASLSFVFSQYNLGNSTLGAHANYSVILGGRYGNITNSASESILIGGNSNESTNFSNITIGGEQNTNNHNFSVIVGGQNITTDNDHTIYTETLKTKGNRNAIKTITSDYDIEQFDDVIRIDASTSSAISTLPKIDATNNGQIYTFKTINVDNSVQLETENGDKFDDTNTVYTFTVVGEMIKVIADASTNEWVFI